MATIEFTGPDAVDRAIDSALTFHFSAVILRGAVPDAQGFELRIAEGRKLGRLPTAILYSEIPKLREAERSIGRWAIAHKRIFTGISSPVGSSRRMGGIAPHTDDRVSPLAMSVGIYKSALFNTQLPPDGRTTHPYPYPCEFDTTRAVDTFEQNPGDLVFLPSFPRPTMHEVEADDDRVAQLFVASTLNDSL